MERRRERERGREGGREGDTFQVFFLITASVKMWAIRDCTTDG